MNKLIINTENKKNIINKNIYGHFAEHLGRCIYEGLYVGENSPIENTKGMRTDVVKALKHIKIPVLRWPGGCFADEYHWKDGIGPKENRKKMINTHWGGVVEDNSFGTHEFMELCSQLGCEPYINANVGSGTVQEMSEWVEYLTFDGMSPMAALREKNGQKEAWRVKYWGVGNENWGCGGNMRPAYYADKYRQFATYCRNFGENKLFKIACGSRDAFYDWTQEVMAVACDHMDALTYHYYTIPNTWQNKGSATDFDNDTYYTTLHKANHMEKLLENHLAIMEKYDPKHRVGLIVDEWGTWFDSEPGTNPGFLYQQNTMRDALVAAVTLNIFNLHSDRVIMANIAQTVNVLQAVVLTEGAKMVLTPTYHVFDLYKVHQDASLLETHLQSDNIVLGEGNTLKTLSASASMAKDGSINITIANLSCTDKAEIEIDLSENAISDVTAYLLSGAKNDYNDFDNGQKVAIKPFEGVCVTGDRLTASLPACSVALITVSKV